MNIEGTAISTLPEELRKFKQNIEIRIKDTPLFRNPPPQLQRWPSNIKFVPRLPPAPVGPPLATIRSQVNPYVKAKDIIGVNDDESVKELLNQGYKIFMCRELYYAISLDTLSGYIYDQENEYYICNSLANGRFQRTNVNPLISINIITGFQGFVEKEQLLTALNSQNNYFEVSEKGENVVVIKGRPNPNVHQICKEANAKKYEIKVIDVIDRTELMGKLIKKTDYSDVFKDVDSDDENEIFTDVASDDEGGLRGGRRKSRTNKRKTIKKTTNKSRKNKSRKNKRKTIKKRTNKRKTKKY